MIHTQAKSSESTIAQRMTERVVTTVKLRMTALTLIGLLLTLGGGIAYLSLINRVATTGFEIRTLEQKVEALKQQGQKLELEATELQSLAIVESETESLGLTEIAKIEYLAAGAPTVAIK